MVTKGEFFRGVALGVADLSSTRLAAVSPALPPSRQRRQPASPGIQRSRSRPLRKPRVGPVRSMTPSDRMSPMICWQDQRHGAPGIRGSFGIGLAVMLAEPESALRGRPAVARTETLDGSFPGASPCGSAPGLFSNRPGFPGLLFDELVVEGRDPRNYAKRVFEGVLHRSRRRWYLRGRPSVARTQTLDGSFPGASPFGSAPGDFLIAPDSRGSLTLVFAGMLVDLFLAFGGEGVWDSHFL